MMPQSSALVHASLLTLALPFAVAQSQSAPVAKAARTNEPIAFNDNVRSAGVLVDGILTIRLEAREGEWKPSGPGGLSVRLAAWAEENKPLRNPGPLIRVPVGTEVRATVRNSLAKPLTVYGLGEQRGIAADSFVVPPGGVREARFTASVPGTHYYAGKTDTVSVFERGEDDSQLNGFLIVDPPGATPRDRLFLISWWARIDSTTATGFGDGLIVINGREWPHTERISARQGDTLHWRWATVTAIPHPMHLHGFYFRVDGKGNGAADTTYTPANRRLVVTEPIFAGQTMAMTWSPTKPGNWIFHCHFAGHMTSLPGLNRKDHTGHAAPIALARTEKARHGDDHMSMMSGLVLGITVAPRGRVAAPAGSARPIRLLIRSRPETYGKLAGYSYSLGEAADDAPLTVPGPTLVLTKGEPVAVTIVNRTYEGAAVHWHGIELESYPDGVPGWSGDGRNTLPTIAPGDSLTVRFTPPRAGTFMYHSHFNEFMQIASGLYGAIVVLEPGESFDPETDRVLLFSEQHPIVSFFKGVPGPALNGRAQPDTIELRAGVRHRLRVINIRSDFPVTAKVLDGDKPVMWRLVAKDGATLPRARATMRPAVSLSLAGEIHDFELTPEKPGLLTLRYGTGFPPTSPWTNVVVRVK